MGIVLLLSGCDTGTSSADSGTLPADGTVTVSLTNADALNTDTFFAYLYAGGEYLVNTESTLKALNYATIASGTASFVLEEEDTDTADDWSPNGVP
ncbi:MAG: hypothetical protein PF518_14250 [Spirochaetaceae bacterium]|nr:hypothetical protein [Spirochaetaceae bacterium]